MKKFLIITLAALITSGTTYARQEIGKPNTREEIRKPNSREEIRKPNSEIIN